MKTSLPASLALALLSLLLPACSTPGTKPAQKSGASFGKQVGGAASSLFYGLMEIPYAILSVPADILSDPATMGAIAQVVETTYSSSSGSSSGGGYSSGGSSYDSGGYTYQNASTRSSSGGGSGSGGADDEEDDGLLTPRQAVAAFEKSEMQKVEDFKRAMLGASSSSTGSGGRMVAPSGQRQVTSHSHRVPAITEGKWTHVGDFDGVRVWWKYWRELKDQVESALKMENLNSYKVTIEYTAWFLAADGTDYQDGGRCSMAPGAVKTGNTGGLFYYVRDAKGRAADPPRSGGIRDTRIYPQN